MRCYWWTHNSLASIGGRGGERDRLGAAGVKVAQGVGDCLQLVKTQVIIVIHHSVLSGSGGATVTLQGRWVSS
ncbi:hypothetical protein O3P69_009232 [Scylla paramamosain]|uniref:Uncharacterized protein n=1 Tax=Scylla paramamosain TaxID=85552 RepID=A0AAW0TAF6_SCYPA